MVNSYDWYAVSQLEDIWPAANNTINHEALNGPSCVQANEARVTPPSQNRVPSQQQ